MKSYYVTCAAHNRCVFSTDTESAALNFIQQVTDRGTVELARVTCVSEEPFNFKNRTSVFVLTETILKTLGIDHQINPTGLTLRKGKP